MIPPIVYVLFVGHFVADFICQSDWMALNKSKRWDALAWHVGAYTMALMLIVAFFQPDSAYPYDSLKQFGWFLGVNAAAHFVQDAITSRITSRRWFIDFDFAGKSAAWVMKDRVVSDVPIYGVRLLETRHWFFVMIGFDQLLHYICLLVTAGWWLR